MRKHIIDIHAHVLPGVDDGARTIVETCSLLRRAYAQGITSVIATPHYSRRRSSEESVKNLRELAEQVRQEVYRVLPEMRLYLGQELFYHEGLAEALKTGRALTMADSEYVLVEFEPSVSYESLYRGIRTLFSAGYRPVLAHIERYRCLRQEDHLADFIGSGCLFQMNYESLRGNRFQANVRWCRRQVLAGRIHMLGTDMHQKDFRPPDITGAWNWLEAHIGEDELEDITRRNALHFFKLSETT